MDEVKRIHPDQIPDTMARILEELVHESDVMEIEVPDSHEAG